MRILKRGSELVFGRIGRWGFRNPVKTIILVLAVALSFFAGLPKITVDNTNESFFHPDDEVLLDYNRFRDQFGKDDFIVIGIKTTDIFSFSSLEQLTNLHQDLEQEVPYLEKLISLVNARVTRGEADELIVENFLEKWPATEEELVTLKSRALANPFYRNNLISEDGVMTAVVLTPLVCVPDSNISKEEIRPQNDCLYFDNEHTRDMVAAIEKVVAKYQRPDFKIILSGLPVVVDSLNIAVLLDLQKMVPISLFIIIIFLFFLFRRFSGVVYPNLIVALTIGSTYGFMGLFGIPMSNITNILASFMLVVSISDSVHILALFYSYFQQTENKEEAIVAALEHSGLAVFMTTVTTAAGIISFTAADVAPFVHLGIVAPVGVFLALFYTVFLLPALIALFPVWRKHNSKETSQKVDRAFGRIAEFSCTKPGLIIVVNGVILIVAIIGITKLQVAHNALHWFAKDSPIRQHTEEIDASMRGTVSLDVMIDSGKADGLYDIDFLNRLEQAAVKFNTFANDEIFIGKVLTLTTILKETNRALHENREEYYTLPADRALAAQELFLFQLSGSDDLDEIVDLNFQKTRFTLKVPYRDATRYRNLVREVEGDLQQRFPEAKVHATGILVLFVELINNVIDTMFRSYGIALLLISFLMIIMLGRLGMGLISMVPNLIPIVMIMGFMGWMGIPIDFGTVLIGSIAIGLVVDDTIHFLHNYGKYYDQYCNSLEATRHTLQTAGRAMFVTSMVLAAGFYSNVLSILGINAVFGLLVGTVILLALVTDYFLVPALLTLVYKDRHVVPC